MTRIMVLAAVLAVSAQADGRHELRGRYAFTTQRDCVYTNTGFHQDGTFIPPTAGQNFQFFRTVSADSGITELDGRGHIHQKGTSNNLNVNCPPAGQNCAAQTDSEFECQGTYSVEDGFIQSTRTCTFTNT